jgi:hypothetical protein
MDDIREPTKIGPPQSVMAEATLVVPTGKKKTVPSTTPEPVFQSIVEQQIQEEIALRGGEGHDRGNSDS